MPHFDGCDKSIVKVCVILSRLSIEASDAALLCCHPTVLNPFQTTVIASYRRHNP